MAIKPKVYGPYKGSKQNGGRKVMVIRRADGSTTSTNAARHKKEKALGKSLRKDQHVDHKDNNKNNNAEPAAASSPLLCVFLLLFCKIIVLRLVGRSK